MSHINSHDVEELVKLFRSPDGKKRLDEFAEMNLKAEDVAEALDVSRQTFRAAFKILCPEYSGWKDYVINYFSMKRYNQSSELFIKIDEEIRERAARVRNPHTSQASDYGQKSNKFL